MEPSQSRYGEPSRAFFRSPFLVYLLLMDRLDDTKLGRNQ